MAKRKTAATATIKVKQTGSPIRRNAIQRLHLKSLGLGKIGRVRELQDNSVVRGLIKKVAHMITIIEN